MKKSIVIILILGYYMSMNAQIKRRTESYFGVHFDFHASEKDVEIGKTFTYGMVDTFLTSVKPDYIQVDSKGVLGFTSYPTKVGNRLEKYSKDILKIWRDATAKNDVALYVHYCGLWDERAIKLNPTWGVTNADSTVSKSIVSVFSPYADSLLIPQLKEVSSDYGVDGAWVDADWVQTVDYSAKAQKLFTAKTGIKSIPFKTEDPHWKEYLNFNRQAFRDYLTHYTTELHKFNPKFQIASNWAYSTFIPEPATIPVDFISGDFSALNSVNSARMECRFIRHQKKTWDLMAWGFSWDWETTGAQSVKTVSQLQRELATVLSLGGGVQIYLPQKHDGSIYRWQMPLLSGASIFVRERQAFCQYSKPVPQIGLVLSSFALYDKTEKTFGSFDDELSQLRGVLNCLLASQKVVDVVAEHHLENINDYPLLIYPEWDTIKPALKNKLMQYVSDGGRLLVIGAKTSKLFENELKVKFSNVPKVKNNGLEYEKWLGNILSLSQTIEITKDVKAFGKYYPGWDMDGEYDIAATITPHGKGQIAAIYMNIGDGYLNFRTTVFRDFMNGLIHEMETPLKVEVTGSHYVDVTLNKLDHKLILHLLNASGPHDNMKVFALDEITPLGPLQISVRHPSKPKKVTLQPDNTPIAFTHKNGVISCSLPKLYIHEMIVIE